MPLLQTPHGTISYATLGKGPPLVILRGLGRTVKHWLGYEQLLAKHFQVITMDLRGIGLSTAACSWRTTVYEMADDVAAVIEALGLPSAHVMGVSLGGMVTLALGLRHPDKCRSLVVVNTSIAGQLTLRLSVGALRAMASGAVAKGDVLQQKLVDVLVGSSCPPERRADVARQYAAIARADGMGGLTVLKQVFAAARFLPQRQLREMRVATLVVYGTDDRFVPNINSRKLVRHLPDARLVPIAGGGHELTLDKPDELAQVVRDWIAERA